MRGIANSPHDLQPILAAPSVSVEADTGTLRLFENLSRLFETRPAQEQPLPLRKVVSQELEMPSGRPNLAFFTLIAASLCAAVVFVGLLIAGDVAGPTVATANSPTHSQERDRQ